jgi:hypothetical protein
MRLWHHDSSQLSCHNQITLRDDLRGGREEHRQPFRRPAGAQWYSSAPSTSWRLMATICASCRYRCARPTLNGFFAAGRTGFSSTHLRRARSDQILFRAACDMGLEGLVSKRSDRPYRGGRSPRIGSKSRTARIMHLSVFSGQKENS